MHSVSIRENNLINELDKIFAQDIQNSYEFSKFVVENFCEITTHDIQPSETKFYSTIIKTKNKTIEDASCTKPGHIVLNWKNLLKAGIEASLPVAAALINPILTFFAALIIWNKIWSCATIKLSREHAVVILTMWRGCDDAHHIAKNHLSKLVNNNCQSFNIPEISEDNLNEICNDLEKMGCIESSLENSNDWWLRERVRIKNN